MEGRELRDGETAGNVILEFRPRPQQHDAGRLPVVALDARRASASCCPSRRSPTSRRPRSPPRATTAASCRSSREHVQAWLNPDAADLAAMYAILDERERPYYEHRLAA